MTQIKRLAGLPPTASREGDLMTRSLERHLCVCLSSTTDSDVARFNAQTSFFPCLQQFPFTHRATRASGVPEQLLGPLKQRKCTCPRCTSGALNTTREQRTTCNTFPSLQPQTKLYGSSRRRRTDKEEPNAKLSPKPQRTPVLHSQRK